MPATQTSSSGESPVRKNRDLLQGVLLGTTYGVLLRGYIVLQGALDRQFQRDVRPSPQALAQYLHSSKHLTVTGEVMTLAFLVLGPILIGLLTVRRLQAAGPRSVWLWITAPWLAVICMMAIVALFAWEGAICVAMALPLTLLFSSVGGIVGGLIVRRAPADSRATACLAMLPFVLAPAETLLPAPNQTRTVENSILIHAASETVWRNIERVPAIAPSELRRNWTHRIGFPRPVEATLSYEGVGGVRHASFERGLLFVETVYAWEPGHRLAFSIHTDSASIPTTTLDEHVTIGGRYFDVLDGEYRLEPLPGGVIRLHLTSHQRLYTDFNGYAGLWTDAVMSSLQGSILQVIQHRCEQQQPSTASTSRD